MLDRIAVRIGWRLRRDHGGLPERRAHERVMPMQSHAVLRAATGDEILGKVLDVSGGGAARHLGGAALYLWDGQSVTIDRRPARVLRHFPGGVVVAFDELLVGDPAELGADARLGVEG